MEDNVLGFKVSFSISGRSCLTLLSPGLLFPVAERRAMNNNSSAQSACTDMPRFAIIQLWDLCEKQTKWFLLTNYKIYQPNKSYIIVLPH